MRPYAKVTVTAALLVVGSALMLVLSSVWYHQRELDKHRRYLGELLSRAPTIAEVESELGEEPLRAVGPTEATEVSRIWTDRRNSPSEIERKVRTWPQTRIYRKSPMLYFIYFDRNGIMRDFSCVVS